MVSLPKLRQAVVIPLVLVLSAAAHGIILRLPVPPPQTAPVSLPKPEVTTRNDISVVILPSQPVAEPPTAAAAAAPPAESVSAPPAAGAAASAALRPPMASPEPPQTPAKNVLAKDTPTPSTDQLPIDDGQDDNRRSAFAFTPSTDAEPLLGYGRDFPHVAAAVGGCFGLSDCRQVSGVGSYRTVARSLVAGLEDDGYTVTLRDDLEDTGRNVYELTPPGASERQFLMVFSGDDGSAIYVIGTEIMTLDELRSLSTQSYRERPSA
ncbi:MAG: hypothetical protein AAGF98_03420 [Cyanobacteria bacterium P01_H01_bin.153]